MIEIKTRDTTIPALSRDSLGAACNRVLSAYRRDTVRNVNLGKSAFQTLEPVAPAPVSAPAPTSSALKPLPMPSLQNRAQRGQKVALNLREIGCARLRVGFGWNVRDARCDIDASAFLVTSTGRVPGDDWFVFYGQPTSPDGSTVFAGDGRVDRETIAIDLARLDPRIESIVFVMTIDEAIERRLNFGMVREAYIRVLDDGTGRELVSYALTDFFENVTSMTLGELYLHRGEWKFNPVGNGMTVDLAGQCAIYGVEIGD